MFVCKVSLSLHPFVSRPSTGSLPHAVGHAPPPAVLPASAVLPTYGALPLMPGFLGAAHPAGPPPGHVAQAATTDWSAYYYVSV